jgi:hypothetical protein
MLPVMAWVPTAGALCATEDPSARRLPTTIAGRIRLIVHELAALHRDADRRGYRFIPPVVVVSEENPAEIPVDTSRTLTRSAKRH